MKIIFEKGKKYVSVVIPKAFEANQKYIDLMVRKFVQKLFQKKGELSTVGDKNS